MVDFKNIFGAVGGFINGVIFVTREKFGVALRLPIVTLERLFKEDGGPPLRNFPGGHVKHQYTVLLERVLSVKGPGALGSPSR
jgi:hypothetical protein